MSLPRLLPLSVHPSSDPVGAPVGGVPSREVLMSPATLNNLVVRSLWTRLEMESDPERKAEIMAELNRLGVRERAVPAKLENR